MSRFLVALMLFVTAIVVAGQNSRTENTPECPKNQVWSLCGRLCEPTCRQPNPNPLFCPAIECSRFTSGCRCDKGYVRHNNQCIKLQECS